MFLSYLNLGAPAELFSTSHRAASVEGHPISLIRANGMEFLVGITPNSGESAIALVVVSASAQSIERRFTVRVRDNVNHGTTFARSRGCYALVLELGTGNGCDGTSGSSRSLSERFSRVTLYFLQ